jgi:lipoprotein NlpI
MKIEQTIEQRELIKITIDDPEIVAQWGDTLDFYIWNKQSIEVVFKFANSHNNDYEDIAEILTELILDKNGKQVLQPGYKMPNDVMFAAFLKLADEIL